jgi:hypothetical protein
MSSWTGDFCRENQVGAVSTRHSQEGDIVPIMPSSAFSAECRVPENAERCRLGLDFSQLADRALGIISGALQGG